MKLICDETLSNVAFKFNVRRYFTAYCGAAQGFELEFTLKDLEAE